MNKFKVGDRVFCIGNTDSDAPFTIGQHYTVTTVRPSDSLIRLDFSAGWWREDQFALVKPDGKTATTAEEKARTDLLEPEFLLEMAQVLAFGDTKHPGAPWKQMTKAQHYGAALRHMFAWWCGAVVDDESKLSHVAHAAVRLMFAWVVSK